MTTRREAALVVLAVAVATVPFLARPFHLDDEVYLRAAEQVLRSPLDPLGGRATMFGEASTALHMNQHPPLVPYLLALAGRLAGGAREVPVHAAFLLFPLGAALGAWSLARRFTRQALPATLLVVATPAFVVSSHSVMTDVPFLAFHLLAAAAGVKAVDTGRRSLFALAGLLLALGCLTQYRALVLVPLLLAYAVLRGRGRLATALAALPALLALAAFSALVHHHHGVWHLLDAGSWVEPRAPRLAADAVAYVALLGGATLAPPFLLGLLPRLGWARVLVPALPLLLLADLGRRGSGPQELALASLVSEGTPWEKALLAAFLLCGLCALAPLWPTGRVLRGLVSLLGGPRPRAEVADECFLFLMAAVPLLSQVAVNLFASARSLLVGLPFLVLIVVRRLEAEPRAVQVEARLLSAAALTAAFALPLAVADWRLARAHRELAGQVAERRGPGRGWFTGEWGFRHYLQQAGFEAMTRAGEGVRRGDLVAVPEVACPADPDPALLARLSLLETLEAGRFPLRVLGLRPRAGFHSNGWGPLPWSLDGGTLETVKVYRADADPRPAGKKPGQAGGREALSR